MVTEGWGEGELCERSTVQFSDSLKEEAFRVSLETINVLKHPVSRYLVISFCCKSTVSYVHLCKYQDGVLS